MAVKNNVSISLLKVIGIPPSPPQNSFGMSEFRHQLYQYKQFRRISNLQCSRHTTIFTYSVSIPWQTIMVLRVKLDFTCSYNYQTLFFTKHFITVRRIRVFRQINRIYPNRLFVAKQIRVNSMYPTVAVSCNGLLYSTDRKLCMYVLSLIGFLCNTSILYAPQQH